jgi:hypothetical protein
MDTLELKACFGALKAANLQHIEFDLDAEDDALRVAYEIEQEWNNADSFFQHSSPSSINNLFAHNVKTERWVFDMRKIKSVIREFEIAQNIYEDFFPNSELSNAPISVNTFHVIIRYKYAKDESVHENERFSSINLAADFIFNKIGEGYFTQDEIMQALKNAETLYYNQVWGGYQVEVSMVETKISLAPIQVEGDATCKTLFITKAGRKIKLALLVRNNANNGWDLSPIIIPILDGELGKKLSNIPSLQKAINLLNELRFQLVDILLV